MYIRPEKVVLRSSEFAKKVILLPTAYQTKQKKTSIIYVSLIRFFLPNLVG